MNDVARFQDTDPLRKPVNTLAIVPQNKKITVLGRKAYNVMLHSAQDQGIDRESYRAPLADIITGIDYSSNDTELIKKHLRSMASTVVEWNSPTTGEGTKWTVCTLISHAKLVKENGQVWVEWAYAQPLKQELLQPTVFAKLSLGMLSQMHTHAGIALYEICSRYKAIGRTSRQSWRWWLPVLTGQPASEKLLKTEYRFFKRDSIKTAIAEVNAITDIEVELVEFKEGKSISELQFFVKQKTQVQLPLKSKAKPVDFSLQKRALALGLTEEKADELAGLFGIENLAHGLTSLEKRIELAFPEPIRDPYRYLKALLNGKDQQNQNINDVSPAAEGQTNGKKEQAVRLAWKEEWLRRKRSEVVAMLREMSAETIADMSAHLQEQMIGSKTHPSVVKRLQENGWDHPMVRHMMIDFVAKATFGEAWDQPSNEDLLDIASQMGVIA